MRNLVSKFPVEIDQSVSNPLGGALHRKTAHVLRVTKSAAGLAEHCLLQRRAFFQQGKQFRDLELHDRRLAHRERATGICRIIRVENRAENLGRNHQLKREDATAFAEFDDFDLAADDDPNLGRFVSFLVDGLAFGKALQVR